MKIDNKVQIMLFKNQECQNNNPNSNNNSRDLHNFHSTIQPPTTTQICICLIMLHYIINVKCQSVYFYHLFLMRWTQLKGPLIKFQDAGRAELI